MRSETLAIEGMSCDHCVRAVRGALEGLSGVTVRRVEVGRAEVDYDEQKVRRDALVSALEEEGYKVVGG
jgi:copper chaperone